MHRVIVGHGEVRNTLFWIYLVLLMVFLHHGFERRIVGLHRRAHAIGHVDAVNRVFTQTAQRHACQSIGANHFNIIESHFFLLNSHLSCGRVQRPKHNHIGTRLFDFGQNRLEVFFSHFKSTHIDRLHAALVHFFCQALTTILSILSTIVQQRNLLSLELVLHKINHGDRLP